MKRFAITAFFLGTISMNAMADCFGTDSFQTCYDYQSGNQRLQTSQTIWTVCCTEKGN